MKRLSLFLGLVLVLQSARCLAQAANKKSGTQIFIVVSITPNGVDTVDVKLKNPRTGYIHSVTLDLSIKKGLDLKVGDHVSEKNTGNGVELKIEWKKDSGKKDKSNKDKSPPQLVKPGLDSDRDALLFLLLVESDPNKNLDDLQEGMKAMRATIENRLQYNVGGAFNAPGAKNWRDIIGARGQFEGFGKDDDGALKVTTTVQRRLDAFYRIANDAKDRRSERYSKFIEAGQSVVDNVGDDPYQDDGGSFAWRTAGSGSPGGNFAELGETAGNEFYTLTDKYKKELINRKKAERERKRKAKHG